jgi:tRNA pseudouridine38-40 synthase
VEYDGSQFHGWQYQCGQCSVQEAVESALSYVADHPVRVIAAGRTDTGVHGIGQVIHFDSAQSRSLRAWLRGTNAHLPTGVTLSWVHPVDAKFHARYSAIARSYRYVLCNREVPPTYLSRLVTWDYRRFNVTRMRSAARTLLGRHDFSAYRAAACQAHSPVRELRRLDIQQLDGWIWFDLLADAFLQRMVRNIVGVLLAIGAGEKEMDWAELVLQSRDRTQGGITAPAAGLYLVNAIYPDTYTGIRRMNPCRFW